MHDDNIVIVINGKPQSGKDTFCKYIEEWCEKQEKDCTIWSTIDYEKDLFIDITGREYNPNSESIEQDRAFLSEFKQLLNKYYDVTYESFVDLIDFYPGVLLVHSREWNEILDFGIYCEANNIPFITVYIDNPNEKEYCNNSDKNCNKNKEDYDIIIHNNEKLEDLQRKAYEFCEQRLL